jgi:hypothetical protein
LTAADDVLVDFGDDPPRRAACSSREQSRGSAF